MPQNNAPHRSHATGRILIVDDEMALRFFIADILTRTGLEVSEASSGEAALMMLDEQHFDVALLDLRMTGIDGVTVMREIKAKWPTTMVIIMTAFATLNSAVEAVRHGAFDYLQKPCDGDEILDVVNRALLAKQSRGEQYALSSATIKNVANSSEVDSTKLVRTGDLQINLASRRVSLDDEWVALTPTEYELLSLLAQVMGQAVTLDVLIQEVLGHPAEDRQSQETLRVHISRLRNKIGNDYIQTVRGGGYVLINLSA